MHTSLCQATAMQSMLRTIVFIIFLSATLSTYASIDRVETSVAGLIDPSVNQRLHHTQEGKARDLATPWISLDAPVEQGKTCDPKAIGACWLPLATPSLLRGLTLIKPILTPIRIVPPTAQDIHAQREQAVARARVRDGWISLGSPPDPKAKCNAANVGNCLLPLSTLASGFPPEAQANTVGKKGKARKNSSSSARSRISEPKPIVLKPLYEGSEPAFVRNAPEMRTNSTGIVPDRVTMGNASATSSTQQQRMSPVAIDTVKPAEVRPLTGSGEGIQTIPMRY